LKTSDFDYQFPEDLIANEPTIKRDRSRLLILNRQNKTIEHKYFYDILDYLRPGDLLVLNNTKVIPANLVGEKVEGGAKIEVLLVKMLKEQVWQCLVKPGKRLKVGSKISFGNGELVGTVLEKLETGEQIICFDCKGDFWEIVNRIGETPLPPYIKNPNLKLQNPKQIQNQKSQLSKRYQTVYAEKEGASAAPTAGLHFTEELLEKIKAFGIGIACVTLHIGLATFVPVRTTNILDHKMHTEYYEIPLETLEAVQKAKRVIAVGTTSVRALESCPLKGFTGETDLFIYPGFKFKVVNAMITNFHWPKSTLIMLVSAFAGRDFVMKAYHEAIRQQYRLFSFGDAMLIA
jgi:S-adenosylmethionine:tRNA ribosyltransferase-isomerase